MKTCLVVDDSSIVRKIARRILEELQFNVVEAEEAEDEIGELAEAGCIRARLPQIRYCTIGGPGG